MVAIHNLVNEIKELRSVVFYLEKAGDKVSDYESTDGIKQLKSLFYDIINLSKFCLTILDAREQELNQENECGLPAFAAFASRGAQLQNKEHKQTPTSKKGTKHALQPTHQSPAEKRQRLDDNAKSKAIWMSTCDNVLKQLKKHTYSWIFLQPVDAIKLNLPDYHQIIKKPMDLGTIKKKLDNKEYTSPQQFAADVRLTFANAMKYNLTGQDAHTMASVMSYLFENKWRALSSKLKPLTLAGECRNHQDEIVVVQKNVLSPAKPLAAVRGTGPKTCKTPAIRSTTSKPGFKKYRPLPVAGADPLGRRLESGSLNPSYGKSNTLASTGQPITKGQRLDRFADSGSQNPSLDRIADSGSQNPTDSESNTSASTGQPIIKGQRLDRIADSGSTNPARRDSKKLSSTSQTITEDRGLHPARRDSNKSASTCPTIIEGQQLGKEAQQLIKNSSKIPDVEVQDAEDEYVNVGDDVPLSSIPPAIVDRDGSLAGSSTSLSSSSSSDSSSSSSSDSSSSSGSSSSSSSGSSSSSSSSGSDSESESDADSPSPRSSPQAASNKEALCDERRPNLPLIDDNVKRPNMAFVGSDSDMEYCFELESELNADSPPSPCSAQASPRKESLCHEARENLPLSDDNIKIPIEEKTHLDAKEEPREGEMAKQESQVSPDKLVRAALLKNRFADTILKAQELLQQKQKAADAGQPSREKEEVQKQTKANIQAEAKRAEAIVATRERLQREAERQAARQALHQMELAVQTTLSNTYLEGLDSMGSFFESGISLKKLSPFMKRKSDLN